jgi:hypothetical protein
MKNIISNERKQIGAKCVFCVTLIVLFLFAAVSPALYLLTNKTPQTQVAAQTDDPPEVSTQALNGVSEYVSFIFDTNGADVSEANFHNFVTVRDFNGAIPQVGFKKISDEQFTLLAPVNGYVKGNTYSIAVADVSFANKEIDSSQKFYFTVKRDEIVDYQIKDSVKTVNNNADVEFQTDGIVTIRGINGEDYVKNDVIIVPVETDYGQISLKIADIISQSQNDITFKYTAPSQNEVLSNADLYLNTDVEIPISSYGADFIAQIEKDTLAASYVQAMDEAVNNVYAAEMGFSTLSVASKL